MLFDHSPVSSRNLTNDDTMIHLVFIIEESGVIKYCSPSSESILNSSHDKIVGKHLIEHVHEDDIILIKNILEESILSTTLHIRFKTNESYINGTASIMNVTDPITSKEVEKLLTFTLDKEGINNQPNSRQTIPALNVHKCEKEDEIGEYAIDLIENLPNGILIIVNEKIEYINNTACELLYTNKNLIVGEQVFNFIDNKFHDIVRHRLHSTSNGRSVGLMEQKWLRGDGTFIDFDVMSSPTTYKGKAASFVVLVNIAHRKNFQNILQKSRERFRTLIQNSIDTIGIVCEEKWVFINESGLKMLEVEAYGDIIGKSIFHNLQKEDYNLIWNLTDQQEVGKKLPVTEQIWSTFSHNKIHTEMVAIPTTYLGKKAIQLIVRDISERKKAEELMIQSEKLSVAGQLAAGIAHEIRNPLTSIKGFFKLIESGNHHTSDYYEIINSELSRIELICSELLLLAKPQSVKYTNVKVSELLHDVILLLETQAVLNDIWFDLNFLVQNDIVLADGNQLKQVFINIIKNAIEAMEQGGTISITTIKNNSNINIIFEDEGPGISEEILTKLGEPFITTKENGTGLGLMITLNIIKNHQGYIDIKNNEGKSGTTFTVQLPLKEAEM